MPLPEELRQSLKSPVADLANMGDRYGGMLVAGLFLQEFVGDRPWAHLDVAGPPDNEGSYGYTPKGGTGMRLRTLLGVLEAAAGPDRARHPPTQRAGRPAAPARNAPPPRGARAASASAPGRASWSMGASACAPV